MPRDEAMRVKRLMGNEFAAMSYRLCMAASKGV